MTGSVVLCTAQGLGYLAKSFYDNGIINKVLIHPHTSRENHREWYPGSAIVSSAEELLETCDTLIFFETPFEWKIIPKAREKGIKTILIPMYESTNWPFPYQPDEVWSPSALDHQFYGEKSTRQIQIPINVKWKLREKVETFIFNNGNGGIDGRNGLHELLQAIPMVKSPAKFIIRSQVPIKIKYDDPRITLKIGTFPDIWSEGEVFVFPEQWNGLSLPIQEAFASGMVVMASDRFPNNTYLPKIPLIPVKSYKKEHIAVEIQRAIIDPQDIANKIDEFYGKDVTDYSLLGKEYGEKNSWQKQKEVLQTLMSVS